MNSLKSASDFGIEVDGYRLDEKAIHMAPKKKRGTRS